MHSIVYICIIHTISKPTIGAISPRSIIYLLMNKISVISEIIKLYNIEIYDLICLQTIEYMS